MLIIIREDHAKKTMEEVIDQKLIGDHQEETYIITIRTPPEEIMIYLIKVEAEVEIMKGSHVRRFLKHKIHMGCITASLAGSQH